MNIAFFETVRFFPTELPKPARHGRTEDAVVPGHARTEGDGATCPAFVYYWDDVPEDDKCRLGDYLRSIAGRPLVGWVHPGEPGDWTVAVLDSALLSERIAEAPDAADGESRLVFDLRIRMRIVEAGNANENIERALTGREHAPSQPRGDR